MPAPTGNLLGLRHGARSQRVVAPLAQRHARRLLRQRGIGASDLSAIGRGLLANWSRCAAMLQLLDAHAEQVGLLDADGVPHPYTTLYTRLVESERRALSALAQHLHTRARDPHDELSDYLEAKYRDAS
ncbi:MAG TPA: hypothetical protein VIM33_05455 [Gaiellaceae bacterium]|jgi:hypothetical protein